HFWLFGGSGTAASGALGATNDLWEYTSGAWTSMPVSGSQTPAANGVYGTKGTADSSNVPGSRTQASAFVDSAGNLWLFGGQGYGAGGTLRRQRECRRRWRSVALRWHRLRRQRQARRAGRSVGIRHRRSQMDLDGWLA